MPDSALVCPRCHGTLSSISTALQCGTCSAEYPVAGGIVDFARGKHYDRFTSPEELTEEHVRGLEFEIEGARRRIEDFYLPLVSGLGRGLGRGLDSGLHSGLHSVLGRATRPAARRILDCGCGNGVSVETLAAYGYDAFGNDLSELRAWQWRASALRDRLVLADSLELPFPDHYFDVVISSGVLEHIGVEESSVPRYSVRALPDRDQQRIAFIKELGRVLAPDGVLFIDCPNGAFPVDFWHGEVAGRPRFHSPRERFLPRYREIAHAAKEAIPGSAVSALSPYRRLQFRQAGRHPHGRFLAPAAGLLFRLIARRPFRWLAATAINPFLVVRITKPGEPRNHSGGEE